MSAVGSAGAWDLASTGFPAIEALGDAVVVVAVGGLSLSGTATLRLVFANRPAETVFELDVGTTGDPEPAVSRVADVDRILAVAASGHADSWMSRHLGGWYELRAVRLDRVGDGTRPAPAAGDGTGTPTAAARKGTGTPTAAAGNGTGTTPVHTVNGTGTAGEGDGVLVMVVARDLGTVSAVPNEAAGATRVALLLEISRRLGAAVREDQVAGVFFDLVCPALGAAPGTLGVVQADGTMTLLRRTANGGVTRSPADPDADRAVVNAVRDGIPALHSPRHGDERATVLTLPLRAGSTTVGAIELPLADGVEFGRGRQEFIDTVAALVAQAVQRARLFDAQLEASLALQHALLPPILPGVERMDLAARYRAGSGHEVGGDWYDVVPLASGWVAVVIGDVQGHDLSAAALMGQVRSVVRGYLLDELPPTAVLAGANRFLSSLGVDRLVTACIALVHPRSRLVTLATAGHARPILIRPGRRGQLLEIPGGPPLGVLDEVIWRERTTPLPADAALVLYTDGLIERRDRPYDTGERQLLDLCALVPDVPAERLADVVLALAGFEAPGQLPPALAAVTEDDTALLLLRWRRPSEHCEPAEGAEVADAAGVTGSDSPRSGGDGGGAGPDADWDDERTGNHMRTLPVTPASAVIARWYVDDLLRSWSVDEDTRETAVLLTNEIVANAVRHAHRTIRLDVTSRHHDVLVEVFDDSHREPRLDVADGDATSGRGLVLVEALASAWGVRMSQGDLGKTVWFTLEFVA